MKIESVDVKSVQMDPANARKHAEKNLAAIKGSLAKFGQRKPIVIRNNVVLAGNGTLAAAIALGWSKINVVRADDLSSVDASAYALADNRSSELADWDLDALKSTLTSLQDIDFDLGAIGFDVDDMATFLPEPKVPGLTDEDEVPENVETRCKPGDLWQLGNHRLLCGDSTNVQHVERLMAGEKADMVFTSPPYNQKLDSFKASGMQKENPGWVEKMGNAYFDSMPEEEYQANQCALLEIIASITTNTASVFYNHKHRYRDKEVVSPLSWLWKTSWKLRQEIIWDRAGSITLNARMFMPVDERIYWMTKGDFYFDDSTDIKSWGSVWRIALKNEIKGVSAPFPNELPTRGITACSKSGDLVFEPYCGSGTTLIACEKTNRKCYGMEIDPKYCSVILARWEKFTGKEAVLVSNG